MSPISRLAALVVAAALSLPSYAAGGGAVWVPALHSSGGFDRIALFPNGVAYAQTENGYAKSTDFGVTWEPRFLPSGPAAQAAPDVAGGYVRFATPTIGYAITLGLPFHDARCKDAATNLARTTDGGDHWTPVCVPAPIANHAIWFAAQPLIVARDGRTVVIAGDVGVKSQSECDGETRGVVYTTTDAGAHWVRAMLPPNTSPGWAAAAWNAKVAALVGYHYVEQADCSRLGDSNSIVMTRDGGRTWRKVYTCKRGEPVCTGVGFASANRLYAGRSDGSTMYSADGGRTFTWGRSLTDWRYQPAISRDPEMARWFWVQGFSFADAQHGYASTRGGGTWRTSDGGRTWVQEQSHECEYHWPGGVGEVSAAAAERALVGGPRWISTRVPAPADPGPCAPDTGQLAPAPVRTGTLVLQPDGTFRIP